MTLGGAQGVTQGKWLECRMYMKVKLGVIIVNMDMKSHTSNTDSRTVCSQVVCEKCVFINGVATIL